jgi:hypothetical protein
MLVSKSATHCLLEHCSDERQGVRCPVYLVEGLRDIMLRAHGKRILY